MHTYWGNYLTVTAPAGDWYDGQAAAHRVSFSRACSRHGVPLGD